MTRTILGQMVRSGTCPRCDGAGTIVQKPCERCEGDGRTLEDVPLELEIPAGIHDGQRIRVRGAGHAGTLGGPPGDVYVTVGVHPLEGLRREGDDLVARVSITMVEAAIGTTVEVPTPPARSRSSWRPERSPAPSMRSEGAGCRRSRRVVGGNLLVEVDVRSRRASRPSSAWSSCGSRRRWVLPPTTTTTTGSSGS